MSKFKLTYFNGGGRADQVRAVFLYTNTEFEDERLSFEEFGKKKVSGEFPFGSVPVLQHGDFQLAQGCAITQYVSQVLGVWPTDAKESAFALQITLAAEDARQKFYSFYFMKDGEEKDKKKKDAIDALGVWQKNCAKLLGNKKFFGGDKISGADLAIFTVFFSIFKPLQIPLEKELDEFTTRVHDSSDKLKAYFK